MKIKIAVDATPIISALIGGFSRNILFDNKFNFISTEYTLREVRKYLCQISKNPGLQKKKLRRHYPYCQLKFVPEIIIKIK
ncbi:MAG: hypothetical protein KKC96_01095 [Nanoarchaeota archaeon]|nr:hypothetical protein [Nanoarchaeota archaeon]